MENLILKVLVGSRAHGLNDENSDYDYRGVFVLPTSEILSLKNVGGKYKANDWFEGKEDQTTYEIGHFLKLATKCNPSILEVFKAPIYLIDKKGNQTTDLFGVELRELFPYVWNPQDAYMAFTGYGYNQRKKMLENKDKRASKYAVAYLRTLINLTDLLTTGDFSLEVKDVTWKKYLLEVRKGNFTNGEIIDDAETLTEQARVLKETCSQEPDLEKVNDFLLKVRRQFWE